jgi:DNA-binding CsgD family transcriptional regulator
MMAAGLRPLDASSGDQESPRGPADRRSDLFLLRKEWNEPAALGQISMLFHAPAARLGLTRAEQRTVLGALLGLTDREIAATGSVSTDAVKKTWRRIHERMALAIPHLEDAAHLPFAADRRSAEKRRHLIEYLRYHPEELRPARAPGPAHRSSRN